MKKLLLSIAIVIFSVLGLNAQGSFNAGINVGLPVGDAGDGWTFNITVDLNYLWEAGNNFRAGIATGYSHSFGESNDLGIIGTFEVDDTQFIPIAGAARFDLSENFALGADLGYAIGLNDGNDGGFYYAPRIQYSVSSSIDIVAAYRGVSLDGGSFDVITLGVEFGL